MYKGKYEQKQTPAASKAPKIPTPEPHSAPSEVPSQQPASQAPQRQRTAQRKRKKRTTKGTYIFYGIYASVILIFFIAVFIAMGALKNWLIDLQSAQPDGPSQEIFSEHFDNPDWSKIYTLAYPDDTWTARKDTFIAYMQETVGNKKLGFQQDSAGVNGDFNKYNIYYFMDEDTGYAIGTFTITAGSQTSSWELGAVDFYFSYKPSFNIITLPGYTVTVNGEALSEDDIIHTVSTRAEEYLPENVHGYQLLTYRITEQTTEPKIVVTDATGQAIDLTFDTETGTYSHAMPQASTISDSEYATLLTAAQTYCRYMIGDVGKAGLSNCFDASTKIYKTITSSTTWMQGYLGFKFGKETITDFYRYSDTLYSAKVSLTLDVTRKNGTVKNYDLSSTFFLEKQGDQWKAIEMTNVEVQEQVTMVRLTYKDADGNMLSSELVDANIKGLTTPTVTVPDGKVFDGWYKEITDAQGNITLSKQFTPDANGNVTIVDTLEPMVLVPQFTEGA
jgi:hypothetical protein